jgi:hypothetical protein
LIILLLLYDHAAKKKEKEHILTTNKRHSLPSSQSTNGNASKENHLLVEHQTRFY